MSKTEYFQKIRFDSVGIVSIGAGPATFTDQVNNVAGIGGKISILNEIITPDPKPGDELVLFYSGGFGTNIEIRPFEGATGNIATPSNMITSFAPGDMARFEFQGTFFGGGYWVLTEMTTFSEYPIFESIAADGSLTGEGGRYLRIQGEGGLDDDLETINAFVDGREIFIRNDDSSGGNIITVVTTGNIVTPDGQPIRMRSNDWIYVRAGDDNNWYVLAYCVTELENPRAPRVLYASVLFSTVAALGGASGTVNLGTLLPAGAEIIDVITRVVTSGTSSDGNTTDLDVATGVSTDPDAYHGAISGFAAPGRYFGTRGVWATGDGAQLVAEFTATGAAPALSHINAGRWDFYAMFMVLPDVA
jgi:hypothetical protein